MLGPLVFFFLALLFGVHFLPILVGSLAVATMVGYALR